MKMEELDEEFMATQKRGLVKERKVTIKCPACKKKVEAIARELSQAIVR